jgi:hypothetical protein
VLDYEGPACSDARAVTIKLDFAADTATLENSDAAPEGNVQTLPNGDQFAGWGTLPDLSECSAGGELLFNARLTSSTIYRGYLLPWSSRTGQAPQPELSA